MTLYPHPLQRRSYLHHHRDDHPVLLKNLDFFTPFFLPTRLYIKRIPKHCMYLLPTYPTSHHHPHPYSLTYSLTHSLTHHPFLSRSIIPLSYICTINFPTLYCFRGDTLRLKVFKATTTVAGCSVFFFVSIFFLCFSSPPIDGMDWNGEFPLGRGALCGALFVHSKKGKKNEKKNVDSYQEKRYYQLLYPREMAITSVRL